MIWWFLAHHLQNCLRVLGALMSWRPCRMQLERFQLPASQSLTSSWILLLCTKTVGLSLGHLLVLLPGWVEGRRQGTSEACGPVWWLLGAWNATNPMLCKCSLHVLCVLSHFSRVWLFCHPKNCSPSGSSVHGISQARILEWVAIPFSRGSFWPRAQTQVSCVSSIGRQILYQLSHLGSPVLIVWKWSHLNANTL